MVKTRKLKMTCETQFLTMQKKYDLLAPSDKQIYASKMTRFKEEYQDVKRGFKRIEDRFNSENDRKKLNNFNAQGVSKFNHNPLETIVLTFTYFRPRRNSILI